MKRRLFLVCTVLLAGAAGILLGQALCSSFGFRDFVGLLAGRGHLLACVEGIGLYEADLASRINELEEDGATTPDEARQQEVLHDLVLDVLVRSADRGHEVPRDQISRQYEVLSAQSGNAAAWNEILKGNATSPPAVISRLSQQSRATAWLERELEKPPDFDDRAQEAFYVAERARFTLPDRFRARHLFLAAHSETPADVVETKRRAIELLEARLAGGEALADLAALLSEDEASKTRGGDLGFFSEQRVPGDFLAILSGLQPGEISKPFQTSLGFHIVQLIEKKPAQDLAFEDSKAEIAAIFRGRDRKTALQRLKTSLLERVEYLRW